MSATPLHVRGKVLSYVKRRHNCCLGGRTAGSSGRECVLPTFWSSAELEQLAAVIFIGGDIGECQGENKRRCPLTGPAYATRRSRIALRGGEPTVRYLAGAARTCFFRNISKKLTPLRFQWAIL